MIITKIAATAAIVLFLGGNVWARLDRSPFPQITTMGEIVGGLMILASVLAAVTAAISWIWSQP